MTAADTVTIGPLALLGWAAAFLVVIVAVGWALSRLMPPAEHDPRPWPSPPRFPPGKVGEFMAEEELRRMAAEERTP